jgi:hypothetical protein
MPRYDLPQSTGDLVGKCAASLINIIDMILHQVMRSFYIVHGLARQFGSEILSESYDDVTCQELSLNFFTYRRIPSSRLTLGL